MSKMMMRLMIITSSKNARPACGSSREKAQCCHRPGLEHIPCTPDHGHDYDYNDHVDDYNDDDDDEGNDHHTYRRHIIPDRLSIEGLQHTCWLIL